tara:strand:- start:13852 stop:14586 length:735 start_codon:yes stop_codon:yes gene_type:complete
MTMSEIKFSIGTWISIPDNALAEILAKAGYEWVVVDLEHTAIGIETAADLIRVIDLAGSKPLVRLSDHSSSQIKRVLDAGARGIIAPMVETKAQGSNILESCFYPPKGKRGMGLSRAQGYGVKALRDNYINELADDVEVYFQIESSAAIKNINEIFSLPINGYFIGPYDLSASLNDPGNFTSDLFKNSEAKVMQAAKDKGIHCGYHLVEPEIDELSALKEQGYSMIAFSVDFRMIDVIARKPFE